MKWFVYSNADYYPDAVIAEADTVTAGRIDATYRAVAAKPHHDPYELPRYAVDENVLDGIRWANGVVERRILSDRDVDHAIRNATERKWAW